MQDVSSQSSFDLMLRGCSEIKATISLILSAGMLCEVRHTAWVIGHSRFRERVIPLWPHVRRTTSASRTGPPSPAHRRRGGFLSHVRSRPIWRVPLNVGWPFEYDSVSTVE